MPVYSVPGCFSAIARSVMISAKIAVVELPVEAESFSAIARSVMISALALLL